MTLLQLCSGMIAFIGKHINAIFSKLGLSEEHDVHKRVKATVIYLAEQSPPAGSP